MDETYSDDKISWKEFEYDYTEKHPDWFWILGIVAVASILTAILAKNFLFAIILLLSAILLGVYGKREPKLIEFTLMPDGIKVDETFYRYQNVKSFWVNKSKSSAILIIETDRLFLPHIDIPLGETDPDKVTSLLKKYLIEEKEVEESLTHKIFEFFGF